MLIKGETPGIGYISNYSCDCRSLFCSLLQMRTYIFRPNWPSSSVQFGTKTRVLQRMVSSGMLRRVALVRTVVSEGLSASFIRVKRIGELGTMLAVITNRISSQRASVPS
jgi:hypothetical protein